jgi:hypothetical protein
MGQLFGLDGIGYIILEEEQEQDDYDDYNHNRSVATAAAKTTTHVLVLPPSNRVSSCIEVSLQFSIWVMPCGGYRRGKILGTRWPRVPATVSMVLDSVGDIVLEEEQKQDDDDDDHYK